MVFARMFWLGGVIEALIVEEGQLVPFSADLQPRHAVKPLAAASFS